MTSGIGYARSQPGIPDNERSHYSRPQHSHLDFLFMKKKNPFPSDFECAVIWELLSINNSSPFPAPFLSCPSEHEELELRINLKSVEWRGEKNKTNLEEKVFGIVYQD